MFVNGNIFKDKVLQNTRKWTTHMICSYAKYLMGKRRKTGFWAVAQMMPSLLLYNFADCFSFVSVCLQTKIRNFTFYFCNVLFYPEKENKTFFFVLFNNSLLFCYATLTEWQLQRSFFRFV
jgi:hypothetical protein